MIKDCELLLNKYYGFKSFRKGQEQAIQSVMNNEDTLIIMPTGGGKSLCYQIPALVKEGITLVISPLIALMKDQVDFLKSIGIKAAFINSTLSAIEMEQVLYWSSKGEYKLLYVSPERLEAQSFCSAISNVNISIIAVDEAHCVSQWGHDFRPSYRNISSFINSLNCRPVVMALTATATEVVKADIINLLNLKEPNKVMTGFNRNNLKFSVVNGEDKKEFLNKFLSKNRGVSGIVYAATRKETENIYKLLINNGYNAGLYHAGLSDSDRTRVQEAFIYDDIEIMVATNAFGMGIDKSNVRYVVHYNMPKNMEAYYQEAGRAGRDGEYSECILLFNTGDVTTQKYFIDESYISKELKSNEYQKLQGMVDYCHTSTCLRSYILNYFGDNDIIDKCDNCSVCCDENELQDITIEAQKILSCVYRAKERYGKTMIIDILKGSKNKKLLECNLDKLSTYGLAATYDRKTLTLILNKLCADGYLKITEELYPVVKLTAKAFDVLRDSEKVYMKIEKISVSTEKNDELFERLKILRKEIALKEKLPPYIIFHDAALREISEKLPVTKNKLRTVKGVGERKLELYGEDIINLIIKYMEDKGIKIVDDDHNSNNYVMVKTSEDKVKSHIVSYNMYSEGKSFDQIASERSLAISTIKSHIIDCYNEGLEVELSDFIPKEYEDLILSKVKELGAFNGLKKIKDALPDEIDYYSIRAVLFKYKDAI
jgi:ATP-dependent DNA helicase RecQ